jgi:serine/threonine protein kinase
MGEVYKARDTRLDRTVAIKVLSAHLADRADLRERFDREAKTIAGRAMEIAKDRITTKALVPSSATRRRIFTSTARLVRTAVPAQSRLTAEVRGGMACILQ